LTTDSGELFTSQGIDVLSTLLKHVTHISNTYRNAGNLPFPEVTRCVAFKVEVNQARKDEDGEQVNLNLLAPMQDV
jgi:hypothetical protein